MVAESAAVGDSSRNLSIYLIIAIEKFKNTILFSVILLNSTGEVYEYENFNLVRFTHFPRHRL